jgi:hypothetical protein
MVPISGKNIASPPVFAVCWVPMELIFWDCPAVFPVSVLLSSLTNCKMPVKRCFKNSIYLDFELD